MHTKKRKYSIHEHLIEKANSGGSHSSHHYHFSIFPVPWMGENNRRCDAKKEAIFVFLSAPASMHILCTIIAYAWINQHAASCSTRHIAAQSQSDRPLSSFSPSSIPSQQHHSPHWNVSSPFRVFRIIATNVHTQRIIIYQSLTRPTHFIWK